MTIHDPDLPKGSERPAPVEVDAETFAAMEALAHSRDAASWSPWQEDGAPLPPTLNDRVRVLEEMVAAALAIPERVAEDHWYDRGYNDALRKVCRALNGEAP